MTWQPPYQRLPFSVSLPCSSAGVSWDQLLDKLHVLKSLSQGRLLGEAKPRHPGNLIMHSAAA